MSVREFDGPGEGWIELTGNEWPADRAVVAFYPSGDLPSTRRWTTRPVVPIPTVPYSLVRFFGGRFAEGGTLLMLQPDGDWISVGERLHWGPYDVRKNDRFEVVSVPVKS